MENFTILLNSTDSFSDCWDAFFTLYRRYWREPRPKLILNSETKTYKAQDIEIINAVTESHFGHRPTWSESIAYCLKLTQSPIVLYLQEDYFLESGVNTAAIDIAIKSMLQHNIACIGLTDHGAHAPFIEGQYPKLLQVRRNARYLVNCQAALWNVRELSELLRPQENAWQFEIFGTARAQRSNRPYFVVRDMAFARLQAINAVPYIAGTGIIKGRWNPTTKALFERNNIEFSSEPRGFYDGIGYIENKLNTFHKLYQNPMQFTRGLLGL
jgi:hypothetical protein